jgi:DNA-binding transcriptional LysR family regulator
MVALRHFRYLTALASEKHFGRAAKRCNVSQPTLSAAIRQLETELGVPIVERGQRFQGFTAEGQRVLDWAHRILNDCDSLQTELGTLRQGLCGKLRLGVIPSALPVVPLVTGPFYRRHPLVTITVLSQSSIDIQSGLDEFEIDAGVTYLDNEPLSGIRSMVLYRERYLLLTPRGGPFSGRSSVGWAEAAGLPLCLLTPNMQYRRIVDSIFRQVDCTVAPEIETDSLVNMCAHIRTGLWSTIVPQGLLNLHALVEEAEIIPLAEPEVSHTVGLVVPDRDPVSPLAAALFALAQGLDLPSEIAKGTVPNPAEIAKKADS